MQPLLLNIVELMVLKHLGRYTSIIAYELFGYPSRSGPSQHVQGKRTELHKLFTADAGLGGRHGLEWAPVTRARLIARDPEEVVK